MLMKFNSKCAKNLSSIVTFAGIIPLQLAKLSISVLTKGLGFGALTTLYIMHSKVYFKGGVQGGLLPPLETWLPPLEICLLVLKNITRERERERCR